MKKFSVLAVIPAVAVLASCAGGPSSEPDVERAGAGSVSASPDCAALAAEMAQAHGERVFVEAGGTTFTVVEARALAADRAIVETTVDQPDLVGYPEVQFLSQCEGGEVVLLGGYVPIDGTFQLLFTTNEGSEAGDVPTAAP